MVLRTASHKVSSHQTRDFECFADRCNIPWNLPTSFHSGLIATILQMSLDTTHCSLSNPMCFWSVLCWRTMIPGKIFTGLAKFQWIVSVNDFWFPGRLQELLQALLCFLRSFCFTWVWLYPLCCPVLCHYSVSKIVSRFTSFIKNFVSDPLLLNHQNVPLWARLYQHVFCKKPFTFFGSQAYVAISVLRDVSEDTMLARYHLCSPLWR